MPGTKEYGEKERVFICPSYEPDLKAVELSLLIPYPRPCIPGNLPIAIEGRRHALHMTAITLRKLFSNRGNGSQGGGGAALIKFLNKSIFELEWNISKVQLNPQVSIPVRSTSMFLGANGSKHTPCR